MTKTTFWDVKQRLDQAFLDMDSKTVAPCIQKANMHLEGLLQHIQAIEDLDNDSNNDSSDEDDSDLLE